MKKSIASFVAVLVIIGFLCATAAFGLNLGFLHIPNVLDEENGIRRGLDLVGGSAITFEAEIPEGYNSQNLSGDMQTAKTMLESRLTSMNYTEAQVTIVGENRLSVEIPSVKNPEEAVQLLGSTAQLQFLDADGNVVMDGSDIKKASAAYGKPTGTEVMDINYVSVTFKPEAQEKFAKATREAAARAAEGKNYIAIALDGEIQSTPSVREEINSDGCVISGNYDAESAKWMADLINIGQMPFTLKQIELRSVGPQLGEQALSTSMTAGAIGVLLVMLFMVIMYRLPGVVSVIALAFYIALEAVILTLCRVNLSLPGIAGIILSIGMAVDANVVIFERIKEELRAGKTIKAAIDSGFHRAFTAIFDSNVTTLIAAIVLYFLGTGTIVGFAITLGLGVVVSMFTAITVTRFLLNRMVDFRIKNPKVYGA